MSLPNLPSLFARIRDAEEQSGRLYEAVIGIVVDNKDPDQLGRVKVRFPTLPIEDTSWWAPVCAPGAGFDRGWWFLPEIDDEVLVMFEHGDVERPVVIGALWNGVDLPPEENGGSNERRVLHSRENSRITLDDAEGTITFEDGGGVGKIVISKQNKIRFEAMQGDVCIQSPNGETSIVANEIQMTATQNAHIQSGTAMAVTSESSLAVKSANITVNAPLTDFNSGASPASAASDACEDVDDPLGS